MSRPKLSLRDMQVCKKLLIYIVFLNKPACTMLQADVDHRRRKRALSQDAAAAWLHAMLGKAWRSWRERQQHSAGKRDAAGVGIAAWRNRLAAGCWRAWAGRAAQRRLLTQRAKAFICEDTVRKFDVFRDVHSGGWRRGKAALRTGGCSPPARQSLHM